MSAGIPIRVRDGYGKNGFQRVGPEGEASVVVHPHPPKDETGHPIPYRQYMTDDGSSSGSNDMRVNGETTSQGFFVCPQDPERDLYVGRLDVLIADAGATLSQFANIGVLGNGIKFEWITREFGTVVLHEGLTTNFEFIRLAGGKPSFGDAATAFRANNMSGNAEGYMASIDFDEVYNLSWGIRLRRGTTDCLKFTIQDDLSSGITEFNAIAYGIEF